MQKFGGTSVATGEGRAQIAQRVARAVREGLSPVVVVSAMGREGDPYATDTLIQLAHSAHSHLAPRELDLLLSCGETIASVVVAGTLTASGLPATALTGGQAGILTDAQHGGASIQRVDPSPLLSRLEAGLIPVVAGYQGLTAEGQVTTLGRGGSDTTAAAVGGALQAEVVEIYTDVDGVKTADPRLVPEARTLRVTTYDEVAQMAHNGAKVVHPRAVEIAMQHRLPLRVRSTFSEATGTLITYSPEAAGAAWSELLAHRPVTGVTHLSGLTQVVLPVAGVEQGRALFRALAEAGVSVDLINLTPPAYTFCVPEAKTHLVERVLADLGLQGAVQTGCAKVTVVGSGMRGRPGVMAVVVEALAEAGVSILQTADSHVTISCLVAASHLRTAARALHDAFGLGRGE